ncbi:MAG: energy-coupling factor transporter transmembrane component T [Heliobacteriaceae bacterium]|nr:energy-coupling factor transporter transmembrane component T [Heliobacteriaceae bacterium]MDD4587995.1 energy-coupling factor transporter transmembrane component T [Heliobacteriaceae bacterium]
MLRDLVLGQYVPLDSAVHRLDARTKILLTLIYSVAVFVLPTLPAVALAGLPVVLGTAFSRLSPAYLVRGLKPLWLLVVFTFLMHLFTPGQVLVTCGPFSVTLEGVSQGLLVALRLVWLVTVASLLTLTTSPIALTDGLERLLAPAKAVKVPVHELAMMTTIALRFVPTLLEETEKIMKAQTARGADFESRSLIRRVRSVVPLLVPLLFSAFRRAEELAMAMEARCYRGGVGRTSFREAYMGKTDWGVLGAGGGFLILAVVWRWGG